MSDDLISRQEAIDSLNDEITVTGEKNAQSVVEYIHRVCKRLNNIPSVESQCWILTSEKLPEPNEIDESGCRRYYLIQNEYGDMMVCSWNGLDWEQMYQHKPIEDKVVAWMLLPQPWEGEVR